jgi:hypothetical protein
MSSSRTWFWRIAVAALGPTLLNASPWGPARTIEAAARLLLLYPAFLILAIVWLVPGIAAAMRFHLPLWLAGPVSAIAVEIARAGIIHWPPSRWWPTIITGGVPLPTGYLFGYPIEAWDGYLYSLRAGCLEAFVAALTLLAVEAVRPNIAFERTRRE